MEDKENLQNQNEEVKQDSAVENSTESIVSAEKTESKKEKKQKNKSKNKKVEVVDDENLSDDELYAKIQTEKLLKKKKVRRITTFACLCLAFILAVCTIVLAVVPVSLKPVCLADGFSTVRIHPNGKINGGQSKAFLKDEDNYNLFLEYYDKAFKQTYISAIFSGSLFAYDVKEMSESVNDVLGVAGTLAKAGKDVVQISFTEEQQFTYQNGKPFESAFISAKYDRTIKFNDAYIVVNSKAGIQQTKVYVVGIYPKINEKGEVVDTINKMIELTVKADTNVFKDFLKTVNA